MKHFSLPLLGAFLYRRQVSSVRKNVPWFAFDILLILQKLAREQTFLRQHSTDTFRGTHCTGQRIVWVRFAAGTDHFKHTVQRQIHWWLAVIHTDIEPSDRMDVDDTIVEWRFYAGPFARVLHKVAVEINILPAH